MGRNQARAEEKEGLEAEEDWGRGGCSQYGSDDDATSTCSTGSPYSGARIGRLAAAGRMWSDDKFEGKVSHQAVELEQCK